MDNLATDDALDDPAWSEVRRALVRMGHRAWASHVWPLSFEPSEGLRAACAVRYGEQHECYSDAEPGDDPVLTAVELMTGQWGITLADGRSSWAAVTDRCNTPSGCNRTCERAGLATLAAIWPDLHPSMRTVIGAAMALGAFPDDSSFVAAWGGELALNADRLLTGADGHRALDDLVGAGFEWDRRMPEVFVWTWENEADDE